MMVLIDTATNWGCAATAANPLVEGLLIAIVDEPHALPIWPAWFAMFVASCLVQAFVSSQSARFMSSPPSPRNAVRITHECGTAPVCRCAAQRPCVAQRLCVEQRPCAAQHPCAAQRLSHTCVARPMVLQLTLSCACFTRLH